MTLTETNSDRSTWGLRNAHDPTVVMDDDGTYVMFSTDAWASGRPPSGGHMRTSRDLITWSFSGTALDGVPAEAELWSKAPGIWAPEVVRWKQSRNRGAQWHMYYSASTFGSNTSAIGLATAPTAQGPWTHQGIVVATQRATHTQNAIDAAVMWDENDNPWFSYGSFFSGLYILPLDRVTGLPVTPGDLGTRIASRPRSVEGAIEGPYLSYRPGSSDNPYLAFVSFNSLVNTYDVRVAASKSPTGPYLDRDGQALVSSDIDGSPLTNQPDRVGTLLLAGHGFHGHEGLIAPGHNSVFQDDSGASFMVHHVRYEAAPKEHSAQIRRMFWLTSGWPAVSPLPYCAENANHTEVLESRSYQGNWEVVDFSWEPDMVPVSTENDLAAPIVRSRLLACSGGRKSFGIFEGAVFEVMEYGRALRAFSGFTRAGATSAERTVAVFGIQRSSTHGEGF